MASIKIRGSPPYFIHATVKHIVRAWPYQINLTLHLPHPWNALSTPFELCELHVLDKLILVRPGINSTMSLPPCSSYLQGKLPVLIMAALECHSFFSVILHFQVEVLRV